MEIIPIQTDAKDEIAKWKKDYQPVIFTKVPFTALVFGSSGTGKSTMIANILIRNFDHLMDIFDVENIYIFAKNGASDVNFRALMTALRQRDPSWSNFSSDLDLNQIRQLIDSNRKLFDEQPKKRLQQRYQKLIIIDDMIMDKAVNGRMTQGEICELAVQGRHQCISTFCLVQNITSINNVVRRNASHIFAFRMNSQTERQKLFEDISHGNLTKNIISKIYDFAISDSKTPDGQGIGFLTYRPYISDINKAFHSSIKRPIVFKLQVKIE